MVSLSLPLASSSITSAGSVHKSSGDNNNNNILFYSANIQFNRNLFSARVGAYVGAVEEMMCVVCVDVTEGA